MTVTGACRCGAVTYELAQDHLPAIYACHCLDCQTASSSAFGLHALLPDAALTVTGVLLDAPYARDGVSGSHYLCAQCLTRLYNTTSAAPGMRVLRAGTLDDSACITPVAHIWVTRKQAWLNLPEQVPSWPQSPTPEAFMAALSKQVQ